MIVAFDTSVLVYLFDEQANAPIDAGTGAPVSDCKDRLDFLIATLQRDKAKIAVIGIADLPLTPRDAQSHLPFDQQDEPTISSDDPGEQPTGA